MKSHYDLILMDCHMPEMDGYTATRRIRQAEAEEGKGTHRFIVALTACALKNDPQICFEAGMDKYISKPFDLRKLQSVVEEHLHADREKHASDISARHREQIAKIQLQDTTVCQSIFRPEFAVVPEGDIAASRPNCPRPHPLFSSGVGLLRHTFAQGGGAEVEMTVSLESSSSPMGVWQTSAACLLSDNRHQASRYSGKCSGIKTGRHYDSRATHCKVAKFHYNERSPIQLRKCHSAFL
ncbi:hypothetical protein Mapa_009104 [Marchantia paleacea]|nr:hypothetical protein Mapa_009104 [Marchantia paleacea]